MSPREAWILNLIQSLGQRMMDCVLDDWAMMFGLTVSSARAMPDDPLFGCTLDEFAAQGAGLIRSMVEVETVHSGPIVILLSGATVIGFLGELQMLTEEARAERQQNGLDEEDLEAFRELGNLACGACNTVTRKLQGVMHVSQSVEDLAVAYATHGSDEVLRDHLPGDEEGLVLSRLTLTLPDGGREPALVLVTREFAGRLDASFRDVLRRGA